MEVKATAKEKGTFTVNYDFGADLAEMIAKFGEETVYNKALDALVIDVQALVRRHASDTVDKDGKVKATGKTQDEIQSIVDGWKPGVGGGATRKSPVEKITDMLGKLTPEQKAALRQQLLG